MLCVSVIFKSTGGEFTPAPTNNTQHMLHSGRGWRPNNDAVNTAAVVVACSCCCSYVVQKALMHPQRHTDRWVKCVQCPGRVMRVCPGRLHARKLCIKSHAAHMMMTRSHIHSSNGITNCAENTQVSYISIIPIAIKSLQAATELCDHLPVSERSRFSAEMSTAGSKLPEKQQQLLGISVCLRACVSTRLTFIPFTWTCRTAQCCSSGLRSIRGLIHAFVCVDVCVDQPTHFVHP